MVSFNLEKIKRGALMKYEQGRDECVRASAEAIVDDTLGEKKDEIIDIIDQLRKGIERAENQVENEIDKEVRELEWGGYIK